MMGICSEAWCINCGGRDASTCAYLFTYVCVCVTHYCGNNLLKLFLGKSRSVNILRMNFTSESEAYYIDFEYIRMYVCK